MTTPSNSAVQNLLPVQAYFNVDGSFNTFIGQGKPFYATSNPVQSGLTITNSTLDSSPIGATTPSTGAFTSFSTTTGTISTQPSGATDIVNLLALQSYAAGISWKQPVACATLTNITLSGLQTIDGYTTLAGDRVIVKNQSTAANNGIYIAASGAWTRSSDANTWNELISAIAFVEYGTQAGSAWFCTATSGGTLGVTAVNWSQFTTSATYTAGTGLTLTGFQFSITPVGTAGTYGSASNVPVITTNASGQVSSVTNTSIAINGNQITSGTIGSSYITGSYTGITGVGTLTAGTWNAGTIGVAYGGTGATTLTGYLIGNGTGAFTASSTIPTTALSGTITNAQLANSTISGVALGGNLANLTAGTNITFSSGTTYNGSTAITINAASTMVYPGAGIANSTGSAWGTSYSTTGTGSVVALATSPTFVTPILGAASATSVTSGTFVANGTTSGSSSTGAYSYGTLSYTDNNHILTMQASQNAYIQMEIQNTNTGATASADVVVGNNNTTASTYYGDFGMNSSGWAGTAGTNSFGAPNMVYLTSTTADLAIGTTTANSIRFVTNSGADNATVSSSGVWSFANTITGSISGNAATATSATSATSATNATNATNTGTTDDTTNASTVYPVWKTNTTGNLPEFTSSTKYSFVPSTGILTTTGLATGAASFSGVITGTANNGFLATARGVNATYAIIGNTGGNTFIGRDDSTGGVISGVAYASLFWATGAYPILFATNGTERFRIGASGQLGIGGATYGTAGQVLTSGGASAAPTWSAATPSTYQANYTVVAGGGGGGNALGTGAYCSAGGGAGGLFIGSLPLSIGTTYTITVGAGGAKSGVGSNSVALGLTALGGGAGQPVSVTANGGSGGGAGDPVGTGGASAGTGTAGQGFGGGSASGGAGTAGGGGGASQAGQGTVGGNGIFENYTRAYYGGGGSAGSGGTTYAGGLGGGGIGAATGSSTAGTANTGGGGGGTYGINAGNQNGLAGGSGIVIIAIPNANYTGTTTGSPTVTTTGSVTILKFTASGSYTA